jgi:hypothetical protein
LLQGQLNAGIHGNPAAARVFLSIAGEPVTQVIDIGNTSDELKCSFEETMKALKGGASEV